MWDLRAPLLLALVLAGLLGPSTAARSQTQGAWAKIRVVVHPQNETERLTRSQLSAIFLGKLSHWPSGADVHVVDLAENHATREVFSRVVHERSAKDVEKAWLRLMLRGHELPPRLASPEEVASFVAGQSGAVGYVPAGTSYDGLKILQVVEDPVLKRRVDPVYTVAARREKVRGIVVLQVTVHPNGAVGSVFPVRTLPHGLTQEAVKAVKQWFYEPATLDGQAVKATIEVAIRFRP